jgi:hypothetical protein
MEFLGKIRFALIFWSPHLSKHYLLLKKKGQTIPHLKRLKKDPRA